MRNFNDDRCKSCLQSKNTCAFIIHDKIEHCPCVECLVKPACQVYCDERLMKSIGVLSRYLAEQPKYKSSFKKDEWLERFYHDFL
jgi:hypothetical protein